MSRKYTPDDWDKLTAQNAYFKQKAVETGEPVVATVQTPRRGLVPYKVKVRERILREIRSKIMTYKGVRSMLSPSTPGMRALVSDFIDDLEDLAVFVSRDGEPLPGQIVEPEE